MAGTTSHNYVFETETSMDYAAADVFRTADAISVTNLSQTWQNYRNARQIRPFDSDICTAL